MKLRLISTLFSLLPLTATAHAFGQNAPPLIRHVLPKPVTARPTGLASVSTAESGGLRNHEPLHQLPSFAATTLDGKSAEIATFKQSTHWLLLYRRESCAPCDRMMTALAGSENTLLKGGTALVIVVADNGKAQSANRLDSVRAKFSTVTAATWLEDSNGAAFKAFKPRGTPMLYALSGDRIQWAIPGLLGDPAIVEKMASSWINTSDPITATSAHASASVLTSTPAKASATKSFATVKH